MAADLTSRFSEDLERLAPGGRIGMAVSGGPDSLALLLLGAAARRGRVEAATVDHQLRPDSAAEARMVADVCARLGVPHAILPVSVPKGASMQAQARAARYEALARWAEERGLAAVATGHHLDDQAETLLMRLARGSGVSGLAGIRSRRSLGSGPAQLVRPLLKWHKSELEQIVRAAGLSPAEDPANSDPRHDRTQVRDLFRDTPLLDPARLAASASHLAEAEEALDYAAHRLFEERAESSGTVLTLAATDLPREFQRRLLLLAITRLGDQAPRGADLDRALDMLSRGETCTLGSLKLEGGARWRLSLAPPRGVSSRPSSP